MTVDPNKAYTITMAPRVVKGRALIGASGGEYAMRGYISAYDAETGALAWRFYSVPGDPSKPFENEVMEMAAKTWHGEWWKMGGGGPVLVASCVSFVSIRCSVICRTVSGAARQTPSASRRRAGGDLSPVRPAVERSDRRGSVGTDARDLPFRSGSRRRVRHLCDLVGHCQPSVVRPEELAARVRTSTSWRQPSPIGRCWPPAGAGAGGDVDSPLSRMNLGK